MKLGIIGAGYMGQAHARVLSEIGPKYGHSLSFVVEPDEQRGRAVASKYGIKWYRTLDELLKSENEKFIPFISSPTSTHLEIIEKLLDSGLDYMFIEKPLGDDVKRAEAIASRYPTSILEKIMVGHIERFNPAYIELKEVLSEGILGSLITVNSRRVGPFTVRIVDVGVVLDLAIHDIDLSLDLAGGRAPEKILSFVYYRYSDKHEDSCYILFDYGSHIHTIEANRVTPYKERKAVITGTNGVAQLDFMQQTLEIYTGKWKMERMIQKKEPLMVEDEEFLKAVSAQTKAPVSFLEGLRNLRIAFEILEKKKRNGSN